MANHKKAKPMTAADRERTKLHLRLVPEVADKLRASAQKNHRSMTAEAGLAILRWCANPEH